MRDFIKRNNLPALLTGVYIALMLTVFLLWFDSSGYRAITDAKLPVFFILSLAYIAVMLILISLGGLIPKPRELSAVQWLITAYLLISVLSAACSPHSAESWIGATRSEGALTISVYCLVFLFISVYGKADRRLLWPLGIGAAALSIVCIPQLYGLNPFSLYPAGLNFFGAGKFYSGQYLGTVGNTGLLAAYFCTVIPLMWVSILRLDGNKRFLLFIPLALSLFVLVKMNVSAGILGVFGGAALSLPVVLKENRKTRKIIAFILISAIICGLAFLYLADVGDGMSHEVHELLHGNASDSFGSSRIYIWKNVLRLVPQRLLLGAGPDTMSFADIAPFTRYDEDLNKLFTTHIDTAHNEYLNVLYHQGIFALAVYLSALIFAALRWIRQSEKNTASAITGAAVLCYCIQAFFGISMFITAPFFWISLALLENSVNNKALCQ